MRPPGRRAHARRRARRPRAGPGRARTAPRLRRPRPHRRGVGQFHADAELLVRGTSSSKTHARCTRSASSSSSRPTSAHLRSAASSTGSSSTRTASSSSPTTRPARCPASAGERRASPACTSTRCCASSMLGRAAGTRAALYLSKPEAIIATPTEQSVTGVERSAPPRCGRDRRRVRARRLPARTRAACATTAPSAVLPRVRRRPGRRRTSCAGPGRHRRPRSPRHARVAASA